MSNATGFAIFRNGDVLWYEYAGTSDVVRPKLHATRKSLYDDWRKGEWTTCRCPGLEGANAEPCIIFSDHGGGAAWAGTACRACMTLVKRPDVLGEFTGKASPEIPGFVSEHPLIRMAMESPEDIPFRYPAEAAAQMPAPLLALPAG